MRSIYTVCKTVKMRAVQEARGKLAGSVHRRTWPKVATARRWNAKYIRRLQNGEDASKTRRARLFRRERTSSTWPRKNVSPTKYCAVYTPFFRKASGISPRASPLSTASSTSSFVRIVSKADWRLGRSYPNPPQYGVFFYCRSPTDCRVPTSSSKG